jgi:hypothetical protein
VGILDTLKGLAILANALVELSGVGQNVLELSNSPKLLLFLSPLDGVSPLVLVFLLLIGLDLHVVLL